MKKVGLILAVLGFSGLGYYVYSSHYYVFMNPPETNPDAQLSIEDVYDLQDYLNYRNQKKDFPAYSNKHKPIIVGQYNGETIEERFWCSDDCWSGTLLYLSYASSTEVSCEDIGGYKLHRFGGWGLDYLGCSPIEI